MRLGQKHQGRHFFTDYCSVQTAEYSMRAYVTECPVIGGARGAEKTNNRILSVFDLQEGGLTRAFAISLMFTILVLMPLPLPST